jgi:hypothetical protein
LTTPYPFVLSRRSFFHLVDRAQHGRGIPPPRDPVRFLLEVFHHFRVPLATQAWLRANARIEERAAVYCCMNPGYGNPWLFAQFLLYEDIAYDHPVSAFLELVRTRYPDTPADVDAWLEQWDWRWFNGIQPAYAKTGELAALAQRLVRCVLTTHPWESTTDRIGISFRHFAEAWGATPAVNVRALGEHRQFARSNFI